MAHTRAQTGTQGAPLSPAPKSKGTRSQRIPPKHTTLRTAEGAFYEPAYKHLEPTHKHLEPAHEHVEQAHKHLEPAHERLEPAHKHLEPADEHVDPLTFWVKEQRWPHEQEWPEATLDTDATMDPPFARKKPASASTLSRKRSSSGTPVTPSDQKPRAEKSVPYQRVAYETLLQFKGSYMKNDPLGLASPSQTFCRSLFEKIPSLPSDTLFRDDIFKTTIETIYSQNEARVIQDIGRLIVPSAETFARFGAVHLDILVESVNAGWNNSIPFTTTRPQPDYAVGFKREAFTNDQLSKLSPFLGDIIAGDQSFFMATHYMYFPFLTCEVKCGDGAINVADRQNAHSMTLAVRGIVELFRFVKRENEVNRQILAFSISHDDQSVRIYGHYPVLDGKYTKYYRHPLRTFYFAEQGGENDRWTAYQFTKNVYDKWMPKHYENICSAINQLPSWTSMSRHSEATGPSADPPTSTSEQDIEQQGPAKRRKCG